MNIAAQNEATSEEEKKLFTKTTASMIKSFLYESERFGMGTLRSHQAYDRGEFLEKIIL